MNVHRRDAETQSFYGFVPVEDSKSLFQILKIIKTLDHLRALASRRLNFLFRDQRSIINDELFMTKCKATDPVKLA